MKSIFVKTLTICAVIFLTCTCKKNQTGGKATLEGVVAHHGVAIPDAYVYVKFKSSEFPGEDYTNYDTYVKADSEGRYKINFYKGSYYIFAMGYDYSIPAPYIVKGGLAVSLRNREHLTKDIAVTED